MPQFAPNSDTITIVIVEDDGGRGPMAFRVITCATAIILSFSLSQVAAQAYTCELGQPHELSHDIEWVEPHPVSVVAQQARDTLTGLGYRFIRSPEGYGTFNTEAKWSWPDHSSLSGWRHLVYPGATLSLTLEPEEVWTRIRLEARLLCVTNQTPPDTHPQDTNFDFFVRDRTLDEASNAVAWPLHRRRVEVYASSCAPLNTGDRAIEVCERIAKRDRDNAQAHLDHALALIRFYKAKDARKPIERYFDLAGEDRETYELLGAEMLGKGSYREARRLHESAVELWPEDQLFLLRLGRAEAGTGRERQALEAFTAVIALDSSFTDAFYYAALVHDQREDEENTRQHCTAATDLLQGQLAGRRDDVDAWIMLAHCYALLDQHVLAVSYFARAYEIDASAASLKRRALLAVSRSFSIVGEQPAAQVPR